MKKYSLFMLLPILLIGCFKKYDYTLKVCDNLYVEEFIVNPAGVAADYLTDSTNFRLYVGNWDTDHENFSYACRGDSIVIEKLGEAGMTMRVLQTSVYSLEALKKAKKMN